MRTIRINLVLAGTAVALLAAALLPNGASVNGQSPPKDSKAVDELIKALKAADPDVRRQAVEALAQLGPDKNKPPFTLEQMLAQAAQDNPDIRVAEAKLREADAELNRTRLLVAQKVVKLYQEVKGQRAAVEQAQQRFKHNEQMVKDKLMAATEMESARQALIQTRAKLESAEAELPFLLGKSDPGQPGAAPALTKLSVVRGHITPSAGEAVDSGPPQRVPVQLYLRFAPDGKSVISRDEKGTLRIWDLATGKEAKLNEDVEFLRRVYLDLTGVLPTAENVQKFLQSKDPNKGAKLVDELLASPDFAQYAHRAWVAKVLAPPPDTIAQRIRKALDTPVAVNFEDKSLAAILEAIEKEHGIPFAVRFKLPNVTLAFKEKMPLGAVLQALQDCTDDVRFVVRDYGVLVTLKNRVPDDATPLNEFWRRAAPAAPARPSPR